MLLKTGSYQGNGVRKRIEVGFRPKAIMMKASTTTWAAFWMPDMWVERSNVLGLSSSYLGGILPNDTGFVVGTAVGVNTANVEHHWIAFGDDGTEDLASASWAGNGINGHVVPFPSNLTAIGGVVKRDGPREAALKIAGMSTVYMQGTAATDAITLGTGQVTLSSSLQVNEYDSVGGLGEAIDGLFFGDSPNCKAITWTGNGLAGRLIPTGLSAPVAAILATPAVGTSCRIMTNTMAGQTAPVTNAAGLASNEMSFSGGSLLVGSSPAVFNANGVQYGAIVFSEKIDASARTRAPAVQVKKRQALFLPAAGQNSYVNCGTSDATLKIDNAITYEFLGAISAVGSNVANPVIARGHPTNGSLYGTPTGYSFSLLASASNDGNLGWAGGQWSPQVTNMMSAAPPLDNCNWRTGILAKYNQFEHVMASIRADGSLILVVNGELRKTRANNNVTLTGIAGHLTCIGARFSAGAAVQNLRMSMVELGIYNRALTLDECKARFERSALGSSIADVTTGLAERWTADNAGGTLLPATVSAANNGTIVAGQIITL